MLAPRRLHRRGVPWWLSGLLLGALTLAHAQQTPRSVSEPVAAASVAAATSSPAAASVPVQHDDAQLRSEIDELRGLVDGRLPSHTSLAALFEIDLGDEAAVAQRVKVLQERLAALNPTTTAAPLPDTLAALRLERDRERLAFLTLPVERRHALAAQERLRDEAQTLVAEKQASEAALAATEQARDKALVAVSRAEDDSARTLATEQARLLAHLGELAALRQTWAHAKEAQLAFRNELLDRYAAVDAGTPLNARQADALYAGIRTDLRKLRAAADRALDALDSPSDIVSLQNLPSLDDERFAKHPRALQRVREVRNEVAHEEAQLREREADERYADAREMMSALRILQARRVALVPALSPAYRAEMTGFTREGLGRVLSEVEHVELMARWYPIERMHQAHDFAAMLGNLVNAGRFGVELFGLIVILAAMLVMRQRIRQWLNRGRLWLDARVHPRSLMLRVDKAMQLLIAVAHELILLLAVYLLFDQLLVSELGAPELATLRSLAYAYAWYRLALASIHRILLTAVSSYRKVNFELNRKILLSLRLIARLVLFVAIYLILAQALLGRGALYGIARNLALFGAFLVGWRLMRNWRGELTRAYLTLSPEGRLARLVRDSENRSFGLLVAAAAFVFIAARALWVWLRDVALGFEQTRKALAYLFRRQLERQSRNQPAPPDPELLPEALQAALTEEAVTQDNLHVANYPELDEVLAIASGLDAGAPGALIAIAGDRGAGKTTWLMQLRDRLDDAIPCRLHAFESRLIGADDVCRQLCAILQLKETTDAQELIAQIGQQPAQVVLLDVGQSLMLRAVGGLAGYELFIRVAQATVDRVLWVVTFAHWPFEYLQRTHPDRDVYDRIIRFDGWSEQQIGELIEARLAAAGFSADYEQLLLNAQTQPLSRRHQPPALGEAAEGLAERYHRLVWDYADGNPRVALHFFRLSLVWQGGSKVVVRLFPIPASTALELFEARTLFVLACLAQHENLTAAEAARSLCFPVAECQRALQLLHQHNFLSREDSGRYRITSHWNRAVLRFLQRQKMLAV